LLGVAVVGLGVGEQHALAYLRNAQCDLRWLYDLDERRTDEVRARIGAGNRTGDLQTILDDSAVDIVSIASFDDAHCEQAVHALRAGKHVFVEKPLCRSVEELSAIKKAWERDRSRHLVSNLVLRAAPIYQWLKRAVRGGDLGEVYAFDGDYLYGRVHKITAGWRQEVKDYSVMQGGGIHLVDLMLWITGQRPAVVAAAGNRITTAGTPFNYNDFMSAMYQFPSGMVGRVTANFGCVHRHQHVVRVFGTRGTFIYDDSGPRLHTSAEPDSSPTVLDLQGLSETKGDLIPPFVEAIVNQDDSMPAVQHECDVISACLAADRAVSSSRAISIQYS